MRKLLIILACCTVLLLLGYTGYRGYKVWKERHWMSMARQFSAKSDTRNALLSLQQVLRFNIRNVEACRMMAGLTEAARSPAALVWRHRVVELDPKSTDDRLALAKTALLLGDYSTATNTLASLDSLAMKSYAYHNLAGTVAIAVGQRDEAATHFSEAARLEPWNSIPQLNLAVVRLQGTNSLDLAEARISLKRVSLSSTNLDLRCLALRALVADARRFKQSEAALDLSAELLKQASSVFQDQLLRLDVLQESKPADYPAALAACQRAAAADHGRIFEMANWQMDRKGPRETLAWLQSLPVQNQTNVSIAVIMAESRTKLQDWRGLQTALEKQDWSELDFMRHAFLARALKGQDLAAAATAEWGLARQLAGKQKARLAMLLQSAARWNWNSEAEEILWTIVNQYPEDQLSFQVLAHALYATGRTRPLLSLYGLQAKRRPADLGAKNNLAMTALLLDAQELRPHDLAREVYQKASTNAAYASTYAFSLHLQKRDTEALKVIEQLPPKALEDPSIAGYYGLILKSTGNQDKSQVYLGWAFKNQMLPEEKQLFEQARSK